MSSDVTMPGWIVLHTHEAQRVPINPETIWRVAELEDHGCVVDYGTRSVNVHESAEVIAEMIGDVIARRVSNMMERVALIRAESEKPAAVDAPSPPDDAGADKRVVEAARNLAYQAITSSKGDCVYKVDKALSDYHAHLSAAKDAEIKRLRAQLASRPAPVAEVPELNISEVEMAWNVSCATGDWGVFARRDGAFKVDHLKFANACIRAALAKMPKREPFDVEAWLRDATRELSMGRADGFTQGVRELLKVLGGAGCREERGWVIERQDSPPGQPRYWTGSRSPAVEWSHPGDYKFAMRFARKIDAQRAAEHAGFCAPNTAHPVREHIWTAGVTVAGEPQ